MTRTNSKPERLPRGRMAAALSALAISLGVSTPAVAEPESGSSVAGQGQASTQHKVESVQGKHRTAAQIKGETATCVQTKIESVQGTHRASTQIKGEGATCTQVKIESQQHKIEKPAEQPQG